MWHDDLHRWMTAREKMAASGLPISEEHCKAAKLTKFADWQSDFAWRKRVGNGQQLQNVGLVFMAALHNLRLKDSAPPNLLDIAPPSYPEGLVELEDKSYLISIEGSSFKLKSKEHALKARGDLRVPRQ